MLFNLDEFTKILDSFVLMVLLGHQLETILSILLHLPWYFCKFLLMLTSGSFQYIWSFISYFLNYAYKDLSVFSYWGLSKTMSRTLLGILVLLSHFSQNVYLMPFPWYNYIRIAIFSHYHYKYKRKYFSYLDTKKEKC